MFCLSELHSQSEGKSGLQRSASPVCVEQIGWVLFYGITSNLRASDAGFISSVLSAGSYPPEWDGVGRGRVKGYFENVLDGAQALSVDN